MRKLIIQSPARRDIEQIWDYIAEHSIKGANLLEEEIDATIRLPHGMPGIGHHRADVRDRTVLFHPVYPYIIAYQYDDSHVAVVRVLHSARDFKRIFKRR